MTMEFWVGVWIWSRRLCWAHRHLPRDETWPPSPVFQTSSSFYRIRFFLKLMRRVVFARKFTQTDHGGSSFHRRNCWWKRVSRTERVLQVGSQRWLVGSWLVVTCMIALVPFPTFGSHSEPHFRWCMASASRRARRANSSRQPAVWRHGVLESPDWSSFRDEGHPR